MEHQRPLINLENVTAGQALTALAFILALSLRLLLLGQNPLTESEAAWANQALALSRGEPALLGPQALYVIFTTLVFWMVKAGEAWARLLPVLSGSLLVLLPSLFTRWIGDSAWARRAALVMSFGLALDPALVALSRQAGSSLPALVFLLLTVGLGSNRRWKLAGITSGLALLSGPAVWQGILSLGLTWGLISLIQRSGTRFVQANNSDPATETHDRVSISQGLRTLFIFGAGTLVIGGTLFFRLPQGLGAFASALPAYLQSWLPASSDLLPTPALRIPLSLLITQPVVVLFAILAILRVWLSKASDPLLNIGQRLSLWAALVLFLTILNPNRQVSDAVWALIPLWALAALELANLVPEETERNDLPIAFTHSAIIALFTTLFAYNLLRLFKLGAQPWLYASVLAGIVLMVLVISLIIAAGWSLRVARLGLLWGIALVLSITMLSNMWYSGFAGPSQPGDLWGRPPAAGQATELLHTLEQLSEWNTGHRTELQILVTVDSAALRWQLRNFSAVQFANGIAPGTLSPVIITAQEQDFLELAAAYRGQDFIWQRYPGWSGLLPVQWLDWLYFHRAPGTAQQIILWARNDLFPGGSLNVSDPTDVQGFPDEEQEFLP